MSFWVRRGDQMGEHGNRELMRAEEEEGGEREGDGGSEIYITAERMFSSRVEDWGCAAK